MRRVLELRLGGAQAATKKIDALLARAGDDDRIRGAFRYHGAATGRWSGEGFQAQNLKRPTVDDLDAAIAAVATGDYRAREELYPQPLSVVGDCTPRDDLCGARARADRRRLQLRSNPGCWRGLPANSGSSTPTGASTPLVIPATSRIVQRRARSSVFPIGTYTKDSPERSVGKTCDLAFGYMGGLGAWRKFEPDRFTDDEVKQFNKEWRAAHPAIRKFWYDVDRAALTAVRERGRVVRCGPVAFKSTGAFLHLRLPSGRKISYPQPRAVGDEQRQHVTFLDNAAGSSRTAAMAMAPMAACGPRMSSPASLAICSLTPCCGSKLPAIRSCCTSTTNSLRGAGGLRQPRRIHPPDDAQTGWALELPIAARPGVASATANRGASIVQVRLTTEQQNPT